MTKKTLKLLTSLSILSWSTAGLAEGGGAPSIINYYEILLHSLGMNHHMIEDWAPVVGSFLTLLLTVILGFAYKSSIAKAGSDVVPSGKMDLKGVVETILEFVHDLAINILGEEKAGPFLSTLFGIFAFIFVSNLTGLVPGLTPATDSFSTNLVLGLFVFLVFNGAGIKEHGLLGYLKIFAGPLLVMAPLIFGIEIIGLLVRPISLALRLYGNIFGDHLVLSVFTSLTKVILPSMLLFFGLLVACLQSFVFTLLSGIYISMAISHDH
ncbi:MAG: F0F1 ATP synthase subunit A [Chitinophagaceae bacterium]|nr:F0F1 ATP synthase subunit A [Oligoflexus sp.]